MWNSIFDFGGTFTFWGQKNIPYIVRNSAKQTATTFDCVRNNTGSRVTV